MTNNDKLRALIAEWRATADTFEKSHPSNVSELRECARELEAALAQQPPVEALAYPDPTPMGYCKYENRAHPKNTGCVEWHIWSEFYHGKPLATQEVEPVCDKNPGTGSGCWRDALDGCLEHDGGEFQPAKGGSE